MSQLSMNVKNTKNKLNQEDVLNVQTVDTETTLEAAPEADSKIAPAADPEAAEAVSEIASAAAPETAQEAVPTDCNKGAIESADHRDQPASAEPVKNAKERMYDKIPLTYKTVDIICKILVVLFIVLIIYLVFLGGGRS